MNLLHIYLEQQETSIDHGFMFLLCNIVYCFIRKYAVIGASAKYGAAEVPDHCVGLSLSFGTDNESYRRHLALF